MKTTFTKPGTFHNVVDPTRIIAIKEMSAGNESVGDMWLETASFDIQTKVLEILEWAKDCKGKLIITYDGSPTTHVDKNGKPLT
jgi:hypothetical protein